MRRMLRTVLLCYMLAAMLWVLPGVAGAAAQEKRMTNAESFLRTHYKQETFNGIYKDALDMFERSLTEEGWNAEQLASAVLKYAETHDMPDVCKLYSLLCNFRSTSYKGPDIEAFDAQILAGVPQLPESALVREPLVWEGILKLGKTYQVYNTVFDPLAMYQAALTGDAVDAKALAGAFIAYAKENNGFTVATVYENIKRLLMPQDLDDADVQVFEEAVYAAKEELQSSEKLAALLEEEITNRERDLQRRRVERWAYGHGGFPSAFSDRSFTDYELGMLLEFFSGISPEEFAEWMPDIKTYMESYREWDDLLEAAKQEGAELPEELRAMLYGGMESQVADNISTLLAKQGLDTALQETVTSVYQTGLRVGGGTDWAAMVDALAALPTAEVPAVYEALSTVLEDEGNLVSFRFALRGQGLPADNALSQCFEEERSTIMARGDCWTLAEMEGFYSSELGFSRPVYEPKNPQPNTALMVSAAGYTSLANNMGKAIEEASGGVIRITDDPDEASLQFCFGVEFIQQGTYSTGNGNIPANATRISVRAYPPGTAAAGQATPSVERTNEPPSVANIREGAQRYNADFPSFTVEDFAEMMEVLQGTGE